MKIQSMFEVLYFLRVQYILRILFCISNMICQDNKNCTVYNKGHQIYEKKGDNTFIKWGGF